MVLIFVVVLFKLVYVSLFVCCFVCEFGVDLMQVQGIGCKGCIVKEDVQVWIKFKLQGGGLVVFEGGMGILLILEVDFLKFGVIEEKLLYWIWQVFVCNIYCSWFNILYVIQFDEVDVIEMEVFCKMEGGLFKEKGICLMLLVFLMCVVVYVLQEFFEVNLLLYLSGESLVIKYYYYFGIVVDMFNGLVVLVVCDVDQKGFVDFVIELGEISVCVCDGKLMLVDFQGVIFMILSFGGIGGIGFMLIVNVLQVVIFGVVWLKWMLVYQDGDFVF